MSEWIAVDVAKPPESHTVLLYIVSFHADGKSIWDEHIYTGFYGDSDWDEEGFYMEEIDGHKYIKESERLKVIAWTLLPRKPYKGILTGDWDG